MKFPTKSNARTVFLLVVPAVLLATLLSIRFSFSEGMGQTEPEPTPVWATPTIVWPMLESLQPAQTAPGYEVLVTGYGGYLFYPPGWYDESYRTFELYFDDQSLSMIGCYVSYCQGDFIVPNDTTLGAHVISTEGGSTLALTVVQESKIYMPLVHVSTDDAVIRKD